MDFTMVIAASWGGNVYRAGESSSYPSRHLPLAELQFSWLLSVLESCRPYQRFMVRYSPSDAIRCLGSGESVRQQATWLLEKLKSRNGSGPIIFVGHGLGGTVIKQAVAFAAQDTIKYGDIYLSTRLFLFLNCLHRATSQFEVINRVAQWISPVIDIRSSSLLQSIETLASYIAEVNEIFYETKMTEFARAVSIYHAEGNDTQAQTNYSLGAFRERLFSITGGEGNDTIVSSIKDAVEIARISSSHPATNEWLQMMHYLAPAAKPVQQSPSLDQKSIHRVLQSGTYRNFCDSGPRSPLALCVYGSNASDVSQSFHHNIQQKPMGGQRIALYFSFDRHDGRRNSALPMVYSFNAQILMASDMNWAKVNGIVDGRFEKRTSFGCWCLYDAMHVFVGLTENKDITCVLENVDQCETKSREQFLEYIRKTIMVTENSFKLLLTAESSLKLPSDWEWESIDTETSLESVAKTEVHNTPPESLRASDTNTESFRATPLNDTTSDLHQSNVLSDDLKHVESMLTTRIGQLYGHNEKLYGFFCAFSDTKFRDMLLSMQTEAMSPIPAERLLHLRLSRPISPQSFLRGLVDTIPESDRPLARNVMAWILCAVRYLSVQELVTVVIWLQRREFIGEAARPKDYSLLHLSSITSMLWGFLAVHNNEVKISHPAVRELFLDTKDDEWFRLGTQGHEWIVCTCLDLLQQDDWQFKEDVKSSSKGETEPARIPKFRSMYEDRSTLHGYIITYWQEHYRRSVITENLRARVKQFFCRKKEDKPFWQLWAVAKMTKSNRLHIAERPKYTVSIPPPLFTALPDAVHPQRSLEAPLEKPTSVDVAKPNCPSPAKLSEKTVSTPLPFLTALGDDVLLQNWLEGPNEKPSSIDVSMALVQAAYVGSQEVVERILALKDHEAWKEGGAYNDALIVAASHNYSGILLHLIKTIPTSFKWSPLILIRVSELGLQEAVEALLDRRCPPNLISSPAQMTPLSRASFNGHAQICRLLLKSWDHELPDKINESRTRSGDVDQNAVKLALKMAANSSGGAQVLQILSEKGVDVLDSGSDGYNALGKACSLGNFQVVKAFLNIAQKSSTIPVGIKEFLKQSVIRGRTKTATCLLDYITLNLEEDVEQIKNDLLVDAITHGRAAVVRALLKRGTQKRDTLLEACNHEPINMAIVELLVNHGAEVKVQDESQHTPISHAARQGNSDCLRYLLNKGADINVQGPQNTTPLMYAARGGFINCVRLLLDHGAELDLRDVSGETALFEAAASGHLEVAELLLDQGAVVTGRGFKGRNVLSLCLSSPAVMQKVLERQSEVNMKDDFGLAPIHWAAYRKTAAAIPILAQFGAEIDMAGSDEVDGASPLAIAAATDDLSTVQSLLEAGADVDQMSQTSNRSALHHATTAEIIQSLLQYRPDPNQVDQDGRTALHHLTSTSKANLAAIKALINARANANLTDKRGRTPLFNIVRYVTRDDAAIEMISFLARKANVNHLCGPNGTALGASCLRNSPDVCTALMDQLGADPWLRDWAGRLPVHLAALKQPEIFRRLINSRSDNAGIVDKTGKSVLHWAAQGGNSETVKMALSRMDGEVDDRDRDGWTALCWAARGCEKRSDDRVVVTSGRADVIKLLLERGAKKNVKVRAFEGTEQWTPYAIAAYHDMPDEILHLIADGAENATQTGKNTHELPQRGKWHNVTCYSCQSYVFGPIFNSRAHVDYDLCFKCRGHDDDLVKGLGNSNHGFNRDELDRDSKLSPRVGFSYHSDFTESDFDSDVSYK